MKNAVFSDIKTQFLLHRRHITSPLQSSAGECYVRFEVFKAVTTKNVFFWMQKRSLYLTGHTLRVSGRVQRVNTM
jgi:hypothetical protein